jgi:hypothetical protein
MKTAIAVLTVLLSASSLSAQPCFEQWYGGSGTDYCYGATQTLDGGYLVYGYTTSYGTGSSDVWLVKTDNHGDTLWTKTIGGAIADVGTDILLKPDSGFVIGGYTSSIGAGRNDFMLLETDANGDTLWFRAYGGDEDDQAYALTRTGDGGYLLAGQTESYGAGDKDIWLVRTDAGGDTLWTRTYGDTGWDAASGVVRTPDGGFAVTGFLFDTDHDHAWLLRLDANGDTLWTRTYGSGERNDYATGLLVTEDRGFIFTGRSQTYGGAFGHLWLVKTDSLGDTLWVRAYGGSEYDYGQTVCPTSDGGYIIVGSSENFGAGDYDIWLVKTDVNGDTAWTRTFGGSRADCGVTVEQTPDGGFIVGGYTTSFGAGAYSFYAIKTDPDGYVGVAEPDRPVARVAAPEGTIISRAQLLAETARPGCELFDAAGRAVRDPAGVSPGVYFLGRETVDKVLVTR